MERIGLVRAASIGAIVGVALIGVQAVLGNAGGAGFGSVAAQGVGGAIGGAFLFALGAVVINAIRGR